MDIVGMVKAGGAVLIIVGIIYYWLKDGLPPPGRGRWRRYLKDQD